MNWFGEMENDDSSGKLQNSKRLREGNWRQVVRRKRKEGRGKGSCLGNQVENWEGGEGNQVSGNFIYTPW